MVGAAGLGAAIWESVAGADAIGRQWHVACEHGLWTIGSRWLPEGCHDSALLKGLLEELAIDGRLGAARRRDPESGPDGPRASRRSCFC